MKNTILFFLLFWASCSFAQNYRIEFDSAASVYKTQDILKFDSLTAVNLFLYTQSFLPKAFEQAKFATQSADKEGGQIVIKSSFSLGVGLGGEKLMHFLLTYQLKDGRVRYTFSNFEYELTGIESPSPGVSNLYPLEQKIAGKSKLIAKTEEKIKAFVDSYIAHVNAAKKDSEW